jgi:A/G-specific adenine glycosylase
MNSSEFSTLLWEQARLLYREMPWRQDTRPYYILVSEIMLQQTQVDRVVPKFEAFIAQFPDEKSLAQASLADVLQLWSGLGYNRRAKFLHEAAKYIIDENAGKFPTTKDALLKLPGVGQNTAGAILTYAYNEAVPFIETNVRTVYIHHFFEDGDKISDKEIASKLIETIDHEHPREFYWALMDYGSWLKRQGLGRLAQSKHYKKQSPLKGSVREIRGALLRALADGPLNLKQLQDMVIYDERFIPALEGLIKDGLVTKNDNLIQLSQ